MSDTCGYLVYQWGEKDYQRGAIRFGENAANGFNRIQDEINTLTSRVRQRDPGFDGFATPPHTAGATAEDIRNLADLARLMVKQASLTKLFTESVRADILHKGRTPGGAPIEWKLVNATDPVDALRQLESDTRTPTMCIPAPAVA